MRKEECLTRKWKEKIKESHLEIFAFKCRGKFNFYLFISFLSEDLFKLKGSKFF